MLADADAVSSTRHSIRRRRVPSTSYGPPDAMQESPAVGDADLNETGRLEAFSDGVFAIAITLLVLEIKVPPSEAPGAPPLGAALRALWPSYVGYAISFVTIGIMWVNHHAMFKYIRRANRTFLLINVLFLACLSFIPFP